MKLADFAAMTRSQASARLAPAPAATPLTAQTTGKRQRAQPEHQRLVVALDRRAEIHGRVAGRDGAIAEILPGAEPAAGAGQEQHAHRRVGLDARENVAHFGVHRIVEAVEPVGTIERQPRDAASTENRMCS